eukprot:CAMPEP_0195281304 /NCGR_PEP_ID=MMETSP0707-20130614/675_1 /TAXON_ID=33640 /ORGANISM="Asterionellopsis glacialis, Strain CCMP134" /LENGTH=326 /DNA_ID=CAMNT_0040340179 /DNA_START=162 /DNA_END=1142 /DNA_ORIENTATION=-
MVQSILAKPLPLACHDFEDQKSQAFNNITDPQDEDLIEHYIKEVYQSWEESPEGRSTPDSSASPLDPFTELATAIDGIQGIDNTSVIPKNVTPTFTNTMRSFQLVAENGKIAENPVFEPIEGDNEDDLESIFDLFLVEEQGKLDPSKNQEITNESQVHVVKPQPDPREVEKHLREIKPNHGRWSQEEHCRFLQGIEQYGRQWRPISLVVRTRTPIQVRTHAQKHFLNDPELEKKSKSPELRPLKRQRVDGCQGISYNGNFGTASNFLNKGRWSEYEHELFLKGIQAHGKDWFKIAGVVQSRTVLQIRSHAQKYFKKIEQSGKNASI